METKVQVDKIDHQSRVGNVVPINPLTHTFSTVPRSFTPMPLPVKYLQATCARFVVVAVLHLLPNIGDCSAACTTDRRTAGST